VTSLTTNSEIPKRGEIWLVNFDPTVGSEIKKIRPAVIISSDAAGKLQIGNHILLKTFGTLK